METLINDLPQQPGPGAADNQCPGILYDLLEAFLPGLAKKNPTVVNAIKKILLQEEAEELINHYLSGLYLDYSFDKFRLGEYLFGIHCIMHLHKLQTFKELDLFINAHMEMFGQIIFDGIEHSSNDDAQSPKSTK